MSNPPSKRRKAVPTAKQRTVKATITLDVATHAKLSAASAMRGVSRSALAASFISDGLRGVVVFDRNASPSAPSEPSASD